VNLTPFFGETSATNPTHEQDGERSR